MSRILTTLVTTLISVMLFGTTASAATPDRNTSSLLPNTFAISKVIEVKAEKPAPKTKTEPKVEKPATPQVVTYTVIAGDTLTSIAEQHQTTWNLIFDKNTELPNPDQITEGMVITIPRMDEVLPPRPTGASPAAPGTQVAQVTTINSTSPYRASGGPNGYDVGWCTWWVKEKRPDIGGYWGNAGYSWLSTAQSAGFSTGAVPVAGSIGVTAGHVVYVESVSGDTISISEMGWNYQANSVPNYRTATSSSFQYIY